MPRHSDEDLATPEHLLHEPRVAWSDHLVSRLDAGEIGAKVGRAAAAYFSDPENLAGLSGSVLLLLLVSRGRHMPLIPALMVSGMGQVGGRLAWRSYRNLEIIAQAARGDA